MTWEWAPFIFAIVWIVGMWIAYIIAIGHEARTVRRRHPTCSRDTAISESKRVFWDTDDFAPLAVFFWPVTVLILLGVGIKNLFGWWTNYFIRKFS